MLATPSSNYCTLCSPPATSPPRSEGSFTLATVYLQGVPRVEYFRLFHEFLSHVDFSRKCLLNNLKIVTELLQWEELRMVCGGFNARWGQLTRASGPGSQVDSPSLYSDLTLIYIVYTPCSVKHPYIPYTMPNALQPYIDYSVTPLCTLSMSSRPLSRRASFQMYAEICPRRS